LPRTSNIDNGLRHCGSRPEKRYRNNCAQDGHGFSVSSLIGFLFITDTPLNAKSLIGIGNRNGADNAAVALRPSPAGAALAATIVF
jgi:hypothetical protein